MDQPTLAGVATTLAMAFIGITQDDGNRAAAPPETGNTSSGLVLRAAGTVEPGPGHKRIIVHVDGTAYEVIVKEPGEGRLYPADPQARLAGH